MMIVSLTGLQLPSVVDEGHLLPDGKFEKGVKITVWTRGLLPELAEGVAKA